MHTRSHSLRITVVLAALAWVLAACAGGEVSDGSAVANVGGGGDDAPEEAAPETPAKPANADEVAPGAAAAMEAVIVDTINMIDAGDFDAWMDKHCDPNRCHDKNARESWKAYQLKTSKNHARHCLHNGGVEVVRWKGDADSAGGIQAYLSCSGRDLPVPIRLRKDGDRYVVHTLSF